MRTFVQFLTESSQAYSWLSPAGEFFSLSGSTTHDDWAYKQGLRIDDLWKRDWFRITFYAMKIYAHNEIMPLNKKQQAALINLAIEKNFTHVIYDGGEIEKIIWSEYDQM